MIYLERPIFPGAWVRAYRPVYFTQGVGQMRTGVNKVDAETQNALHELKEEILVGVKDIVQKENEHLKEKLDMQIDHVKETTGRHDKYHTEHFSDIKEIKEKLLPSQKEEILKTIKSDSRHGASFIISMVALGFTILGGIILLINNVA